MEIHIPHKRENGKYICSGCGRQVDFSELYCCETCGYFYCTSCLEKHKCRINEDGIVEILPFDPFCFNKPNTKNPNPDIQKEEIKFFNSRNSGKQSKEATRIERGFCRKCGDVIPTKELLFCSECGKYFCKNCIEIHRCNPDDIKKYKEIIEERRMREWMRREERERAKRIFYAQYNHQSQQQQQQPEKRNIVERVRCDSCGNYFLRDELKKCHTCGAVLCPVCREHHKHSIIDTLFKR